MVAHSTSTLVGSDPGVSNNGASSGVAFNLGSSAYFAIETNGNVVLDSLQTLAGGQATTISGVAISDATSGLVVSGSTLIFPALPTPTGGSYRSEDVITIGTDVYTALSISSGSDSGAVGLEDGSTTLTLSIGGSATVADGKTVKAGLSGIVVASGTLTSTMAPFNTAGSTASREASRSQAISPSSTTRNGSAATASQIVGLWSLIALAVLVAVGVS